MILPNVLKTFKSFKLYFKTFDIPRHWSKIREVCICSKLLATLDCALIGQNHATQTHNLSNSHEEFAPSSSFGRQGLGFEPSVAGCSPCPTGLNRDFGFFDRLYQVSRAHYEGSGFYDRLYPVNWLFPP
jgi:hypothetical protein